MVNVHTATYQRSCRATITAGKGTANYDRKSIVNYDGPKRKMQREVAEQRIEKDVKMNLHNRERRGRGICKEEYAKCKKRRGRGMCKKRRQRGICKKRRQRGICKKRRQKRNMQREEEEEYAKIGGVFKEKRGCDLEGTSWQVLSIIFLLLIPNFICCSFVATTADNNVIIAIAIFRQM